MTTGKADAASVVQLAISKQPNRLVVVVSGLGKFISFLQYEKPPARSRTAWLLWYRAVTEKFGGVRGHG
jgi:hypothetical protein